MASAQNPAKLSSELAVTSYYWDPADATTEAHLTWVDMRDYEKFMAVVMTTIGAQVTAKLYCSGSSTGADTPVLIRSSTTAATADAVGDYIVLECTAEEIAALATATCVHPRYVSIKLDMNAAGDTAAYTYIRAGGKQGASLTADYIS